MCNLNIIKRKALEKMDKAIIEQLRYMEETGESLEKFHLDSIDCDFTPEEENKARTNINKINSSLQALVSCCYYHGIESSLLPNYKETSINIIE